MSAPAPKHTPGPWKAVIRHDALDVVVAPDGISVCTIDRNRRDESAADAALIAAAPETAAERDRLKATNAELVKALEGLMGMGGPPWTRKELNVVGAARAALAAAAKGVS